MEYIEQYICDYCGESYLYSEVGMITTKEMHSEMQTCISYFCSTRCIWRYFE